MLGGRMIPMARTSYPPPSTPSVPESRGHAADRCGNEGADHHILTPYYLRPPSPEKNAPRAGNSRSKRKGGPGGVGAWMSAPPTGVSGDGVWVMAAE